MFTCFLVHFIRLIIPRTAYPSIDRRAPISLKSVPRARLGSALFSNITSTREDGERRAYRARRETPWDHARLNFLVGGNGGGGRRDTGDTGVGGGSTSRGLSGPEGHVVSGFEIP